MENIKLHYDKIIIKKRLLIKQGDLYLPSFGISLLKGKNGVGKTLLLSNIFFNSNDRAVLLAQDNFEIIKSLSVMDNITMCQDNSTLNIKVLELLKQLDLEYILDLDPKQLSGGEKRIISILRCIFSDAEIILMDEPTNDLDYRLVNKLLDIFNIYKDMKSFFIITHDCRMDAIADEIYTIKEYELVKTKESCEFSDFKAINSQKKSNNNKKLILNKAFKRNIHINIFVILLIFLFSLWILILTIGDNHNMSKINSGQVDIINPISLSGQSLLTEGALPIDVVTSLVDKDTNISKLNDIIKKAYIKASTSPINYGIELRSTDFYTVYPLEYYDSFERAHYLIMDIYMDEIHKEPSKSSVIDTSKVFSIDQNSLSGYDKIYPFDHNLFLDSVDKFLKDSKSHNSNLVFITVVLEENYSFYDFLQSSDIKNIISKNYFIRSNETIELVNQCNKFNKYRSIVKIAIIVSLVFIIYELLITYTMMYINSKTITILRNFGYKKSVVRKSIISINNDNIIRVLGFLLLLIIHIIVLARHDELSYILNYFSLFSFSITMYLSNNIKKKIVKRKINKFYDWRYR